MIVAFLPSRHELVGELNLVEGSMTVKTTKKTWDPYIILKATKCTRCVHHVRLCEVLQNWHVDLMWRPGQRHDQTFGKERAFSTSKEGFAR